MYFIIFWKYFCQETADYYFYRGLRKGLNSIEGIKDMDKYHQWIDYKFMFE